MALICPKCGAENRDAAKFCLKCAHQLVALGPAPAPPEAPRKRRRKRRPAEAEATAPGKRPHAVLIALLAVFAIGALWGIGRIAARTPAPLAEAPAVAAPAPRPPPAPPAPSLAAAPPVTPAIAPACAPAAAPAPAPAAVIDSKPAAPTPARPAPAPRPARPEVTAPPPPPAPVAEAPRPAPPPAPASPPAGLCADSRFLAHALCLQRECGKPALQQHPQCVRMREQQRAIQQGSGDG